MGGDDQDVRKQGAMRKAVITGFTVVLEMVSGGLFMENVKLEKQRTSLPYPKICKQILSQGIVGFEAGLVPWGIILGLAKGTVLGGSRAFLLNGLLNANVPKKHADLISGFGAGAVQGVFMSPILLARTRVNQSLANRAKQSGGKVKTGVFKEVVLSTTILSDSIKKNGWKTLATGMPQMVLKRALDWGTRFIFFGMWREKFRNMKAAKGDTSPLNDWERLSSSFLGGATSVGITMPIDRLMPLIQQKGAKNEGSALAILKKKIATDGIGTLQRGFLIRATHTGYHTMFSIFLANKIYTALEPKDPKAEKKNKKKNKKSKI